MSGFFLVHRGWMDSFKPEPFTEREAYLWSIEQAACAPIIARGPGGPVPLERGQVAISLRDLSKAFGWSSARVRGFLLRMERAAVWSIDRVGSTLVIHVNGFDELVPPVGGDLQ